MAHLRYYSKEMALLFVESRVSQNYLSRELILFSARYLLIYNRPLVQDDWFGKCFLILTVHPTTMQSP